MSKDPKFPARMWHPETGESQACMSAEEVPPGWIDHHPNQVQDPRPAPKPVDNVLPMTRKEIVAALDEAGISYQRNAGVKALYDVLGASLRNFLTEAEVTFDPSADVPTLLKLAKPPE